MDRHIQLCSGEQMGRTIGTVELKSSYFEWRGAELPASESENCCYESPTFLWFDAAWNLSVQREQASKEEGERKIGVYLSAWGLQSDVVLRIQTHIMYRNTVLYVSEERVIQYDETFYKRRLIAEDIDRIQLAKEIRRLGTIWEMKIACVLIFDIQDRVPSESNAESEDSTEKPLKNFIQTSKNVYKDHFLNESSSDFTLETNNVKFPCHLKILHESSPFFAAAIRNDMLEQKSNTLKLDWLEPDILKDILQFIYCAETAPVTLDKVLKIYEACNHLNFEDLQETCAKFIRDSLNTKNVCLIADHGDMCNDKILLNFVVAFIAKNASEVLISDQWLEFEQESRYLAKQILRQILFDNEYKIVRSNRES